jgi:cytochrome c oxidase subunit 3
MNASQPGYAPNESNAPADVGRLGMWVFLATEVLFFGGLLLAYLYGRTHWPEGFRAAGQHTDVVLGTVNTALLLSGSALVAVAVACTEADERKQRWVPWLFGLSALLGCAFIAIKGVEYSHEWHEGLFPGPGFTLSDATGAELFFMLYFVMTGLHAVHLAIGIGLLALFAWGSARGRRWVTPSRIEIAGLYWHFVDLVWIFLYPLLYLVGRAT